MRKNSKVMIGKTLLSLVSTRLPRRKSKIALNLMFREMTLMKRSRFRPATLPDRKTLRLPKRRRRRLLKLTKMPETCSPRPVLMLKLPKLKEERVKLPDSLK